MSSEQKATRDFNEVLGVEIIEATGDRVVTRFTITTELLQPFGIPHGGIYCAVHESTASIAGQVWLGDRGVVVGTSNLTDFLRQAAVGDTITVRATPIHRGRTQQLWKTESVDQNDRAIAQGQVRLANLDQKPPAGVIERMSGTLKGSTD